jgi:hypothetical protein
MKTFRFLAVALALTALALFNTPSERWSLTPFAPAELHAQATTTQTTLSAAVTVSDRVIVVASATGFAAGRTAVVDGEAFVVASNYVSGTTIPVQRGANSTGVTAHASGAVVLAGPPNYFAKTIRLARARPRIRSPCRSSTGERATVRGQCLQLPGRECDHAAVAVV